jgi:hypothetical protein
MQEGFAVQPDKLTEFKDEVAKVAGNNKTIVAHLREVGETKITELLGAPRGTSGPPVEFAEASRSMLINLHTMIGKLHGLHAAIESQFTFMDKALEDSRELYVQMDQERANVFDNLRDDDPRGGR